MTIRTGSDMASPTTESFANLDRRKAHEQVAERIRERIVEQQLVSSHRLPTERELAEQFGVSRAAVREGLRTLELKGMLTIRKGAKGGIFVAQDYGRPIAECIVDLLSGGEASLDDLFEVRKLIEPYAAECCARRRSDADLADLRLLFAQANAEHARGATVRDLNIEFHRRVMAASGNPILALIGDAVLRLLSERIRNIATPRPAESVLDKHGSLLRAIARRHAKRARELMEQDIRTIGKSFANNGRPKAPPALA